MLTMLRIKENKNEGFFKRIFQPKAEAYLRTAGDVTYLEIICVKGKKGLPWKKIEELLCGKENRVLMPKGIFPPESSFIKKFKSFEYDIALMEEMLVQTLNKIKNKGKLSLALCIKNVNEAKRILLKTVSLAANIKVITAFPEDFSEIQMEILNKTGAAIQITQNYKVCDNCNVIFAPDYLPFGVKGGKEKIIFSQNKRCEGIILRHIKNEFPQELEKIYTDEYDEREFAAAFYELGESKMKSLLAPVCAINIARNYTAEELAEQIEKYINIPTAE